ncbi:MAG: allantoicase [Alphaproteobacteria bacterium]|nr:allantoicase [Alphaproteobacteria bacterium]
MIQDAARFAGLIDLAAASLGGEALLASDDFFAEKENLLQPGRGVFIPERYTERGKWMDGWESRRRRTPGHDWCILRLGAPGVVRAVDVDTNHFTGNFPAFASVHACHAPGASAAELRDEVEWTLIVPQAALRGGSQNLMLAQTLGDWTHLRLNIYPDGGVARLRAWGEPTPAEAREGERIDLAAMLNGGRALACSDMYFSDMSNLIRPGRSADMSGGWETKRSRPPGQDQVILALGQPGRVEEIELDTNWFKGNYPDRCEVEGLYWPGAPASALIASDQWRPVLPTTSLRAHEQARHPTADVGPWTHLRLRIYPDGGVSRLRAWGRAEASTAWQEDPLLRRLNGAEDRAALLQRCCGARRWVAQMCQTERYMSRAQLLGQAEQAWWHLDEADWREAFTHHPRIGADVDTLRARFGATASWSQGEQSGVQGASEQTLEALAAGNRDYEARYGYIFVVCASGLSAGEMLQRLQARMHNSPENELRIAAGEQAKITRLRLLKLESET